MRDTKISWNTFQFLIYLLICCFPSNLNAFRKFHVVVWTSRAIWIWQIYKSFQCATCGLLVILPTSTSGICRECAVNITFRFLYSKLKNSLQEFKRNGYRPRARKLLCFVDVHWTAHQHSKYFPQVTLKSFRNGKCFSNSSVMHRLSKLFWFFSDNMHQIVLSAVNCNTKASIHK